jgi:hypothetical protein
MGHALSLLLAHRSPRIQHRTAQLLGVLALHLSFCAALSSSETTVRLVERASDSPSAAVRLAAVHTLQALLSRPCAAHTQLVEGGCLPRLLQLLVLSSQEAHAASQAAAAAASAAAQPTTGKPAAGGAKQPTVDANASPGGCSLDYSKPVAAKPVCGALVSCCLTDNSVLGGQIDG